MLDPAGPSAADAAMLWWGMFFWFTLVLVAVIAFWFVAVRRDPGERSEAEIRRFQNRLIVGGGLVLPIVSVTTILAFGIPAGHRMLSLPGTGEDTMVVEVTAHQWRWEFNYPDMGISIVNEVHIPAGRPVDIHLHTSDVIHSFWVPRLAGKLDAIPGRVNVMRLEADEPGIYEGQCAEFCGTAHAFMQFRVIAHEDEDFQTWLEDMQAND